MNKIKKYIGTLVGVVALGLIFGMNARHALSGYGVRDGKLHTEVLAQSYSGYGTGVSSGYGTGNNSGSNSGSSSGNSTGYGSGSGYGTGNSSNGTGGFTPPASQGIPVHKSPASGGLGYSCDDSRNTTCLIPY